MGPLAGKRIIEMGGIGPAPVCGMMLADMGAEVILIERKADPVNRTGMLENANAKIMNRGKKSIAIDLKAQGAIDIMLRLLRDADGLIEAFRPGVMERLGLGPNACLDANPRLAYGRMTGWGQDGPLSQAAGHDINYVALSGALWYGGRADSPPTVPPTLVGDIAGGSMLLAVGMLAAMLNAQSTGKGQVVDAAISDGSAAATSLLYALFQNGQWSPQRQDNPLDGASHWYDTYETADGKYVSVGSIEPQFYALLLEKLGLADDPDFADQYDKQRWPELKRRFAELFRAKTRAEWCDLMEGTDICFAPVLDFDDAPEHPHNLARGTFTEVAGVKQPAPAPRFSETRSEIASAPPDLGQDTDGVLAAAGYSEAQLANLRGQGVI
ncbi:MAG: CoA transferase [Gammaproteobacteria bacterium]|jgi:alpha-methylacyl-CoA racemase|nr:CoA transferase [Gammaproteobacteria bacterium]MDH3811581.1 CoA transferase [Gammaproteobacteria bacterium]